MECSIISITRDQAGNRKFPTNVDRVLFHVNLVYYFFSNNAFIIEAEESQHNNSRLLTKGLLCSAHDQRLLYVGYRIRAWNQMAY